MGIFWLLASTIASPWDISLDMPTKLEFEFDILLLKWGMSAHLVPLFPVRFKVNGEGLAKARIAVLCNICNEERIPISCDESGL